MIKKPSAGVCLCQLVMGLGLLFTRIDAKIEGDPSYTARNIERQFKYSQYGLNTAGCILLYASGKNFYKRKMYEELYNSKNNP